MQQTTPVTEIDSFPTKRGVARFTDEAIVFEESVLGYGRSLYQGYWREHGGWRRLLFVSYVLLPILGLVWLALLVRSGDALLYLGGTLSALVGLRLIAHLRGFRSPNRIALSDVEAVSVTLGSRALTRPGLVVRYRDGDAVLKRRVNLPSLSMKDREATVDRAIEAFEARGCVVEGDVET